MMVDADSETWALDRADVLAVRDGDLDRFAGLVERHQQQLWAAARSCGCDGESARELVQQTFVEVYLHLNRYDADRPLGPWMHRILRNLLVQEVRKRRCHWRHEERYRQHLEQLATREDGAEDSEPQLSALRRCLDGLSPTARRIVDGFYTAGLDLETIAEGIKRSAAATKQLLWRSRKALRACIEQAAEGGLR
jgi:RNA polymerase sigma-70 factor (ECF subfamily)